VNDPISHTVVREQTTGDVHPVKSNGIKTLLPRLMKTMLYEFCEEGIQRKEPA